MTEYGSPLAHSFVCHSHTFVKTTNKTEYAFGYIMRRMCFYGPQFSKPANNFRLAAHGSSLSERHVRASLFFVFVLLLFDVILARLFYLELAQLSLLNRSIQGCGKHYNNDWMNWMYIFEYRVPTIKHILTKYKLTQFIHQKFIFF